MRVCSIKIVSLRLENSGSAARWDWLAATVITHTDAPWMPLRFRGLGLESLEGVTLGHPGESPRKQKQPTAVLDSETS